MRITIKHGAIASIISFVLGFSGSLVAGVVTFTENAQPKQVCLYREACDGTWCKAKAIIDFAGDIAGAEMKPHPEVWRFPQSAVVALMGTAQVLNDAARPDPAQFPQTRTVVDAGP
jgi:hypothetical protein